jgi:hypothetical protein
MVPNTLAWKREASQFPRPPVAAQAENLKVNWLFNDRNAAEIYFNQANLRPCAYDNSSLHKGVV